MANILIADMPIGQKVSFNTYGSVDSVTSFSGELVAKIAGKHLPLPTAAFASHSSIYSLLPDDVKSITDDNYQSYNYIQLAKDNGGTAYIGLPWIQETTVSETVDRIATIVLTGVTDLTGTALRSLLEQNGRTVSSITFSS